jgi:hypothetical protein
MAIKFEKITAGMTLYDRHSYQMGNTTLRSIGEWVVRILEIDREQRRALVSWNGNTPEWRHASYVEALSPWSMHDKGVAELTKGMLTGQVVRVRKLTKAEREAKKT